MTAPALEKHWTVGELAALWGLSRRTVGRMLEGQPGVLRWESERQAKQRRKRHYVTLRVPESVAIRVHGKHVGTNLSTDIRPKAV